MREITDQKKTRIWTLFKQCQSFGIIFVLFSWFKVFLGVPQWSILSLLLFSNIPNDLLLLIKATDISQFYR